jgi:hypothetical protein
MAASRRPTQAQIRERRSRIAAVVLGVVFLAVAVLQGPKLLKMISGGSSSSPPPASTQASTTPGAVGTTTPGGVAVAAPVLGQLQRFSLFNPGVPFKPIPKPPSASPSPAAGTAAEPATAAGTAAEPATAAVTAAKPGAAPAATTTQTTPSAVKPPETKAPVAAPPATTTTPAPPVTFTVPNGVPAALVTVNGNKQLFGAGATFPQESPLFKLAAIAKKGLEISVLGGSFADGQQYLVLQQGNKVTLLNQSDGSKFVIVYVKKTFADATQLTSPIQTSATATTPGATPPAAPAPSATTATAPLATAG